MLIGSEPLDLRLTLIDSAQCFRWSEVEGRFGAAFEEGPVWLWSTEEGIKAEGAFDAEKLRRYLDLDRDYAAIAVEYAHIPAARDAIALFPGLRVLNQPPWEALVGFILSANNNVGRIRGLVGALCRALGPRLETPRGALYGCMGQFRASWLLRKCSVPPSGFSARSSAAASAACGRLAALGTPWSTRVSV